MLYNMAIYYNKKVIYTMEVEADTIEQAREIIWDNFIEVAYADEDYSLLNNEEEE